MTLLVTLASEAIGEKTWWNPYLKGALIALMAVGLFVGSAYLLLYTNVGSRLGFLLTAAAFTGFMAVLSVFWITGQFPNGPLGPASSWPVQEVVTDPSESRYEPVRTILEEGEEASGEVVGQVAAELEVELRDGDGEFDVFERSESFQAVQVYARGGGRKWPVWWSEHTQYAVTEVCPTTQPASLPLEPPPPAECHPERDAVWVVSIHDLGARRLPAWFFFLGSSALFALTLLSLHFYERDLARPAAGAGPSGGGGGGGNGDAGGGDGAGSSGAPAEAEPATT